MPKTRNALQPIWLKFCKNVNITDVTFREAGHFAIIVNGCNGMKLDRITVDSPDDRDGINFINSSNIELSNSTIISSDDAVAFKSDFGDPIPVDSLTLVLVARRKGTEIAQGPLVAYDGSAIRFTPIRSIASTCARDRRRASGNSFCADSMYWRT